MKLHQIASTLVAFVFAAVAHAASITIEGLPIKIGDSVEDVQKAYDTKLEPESVSSPTPTITPPRTQLHLKTKGVWVWFEKGKATTIRLDAPFSGDIGGIKIGSLASRIEKAFGPPVKRGTFGTMTTYTYYFDDITTTRFDVNRDDTVETIFFFK